MMATFKIVRVKGVSIFRQLQVEEALLRADTGNWCIINEGSPEAIVMGISSKVEDLLNLEKLRERPIPVIRRFSGGGTVVVDHQTCFVTLICNMDCVGVPGIPYQIIHWAGSLYSGMFDPGCFAVRENDYVLGERKFGGNAQYICKQRWLHHSSLLWDFHEDNMDYLQIPKKAPQYRQDRDHTDFLCRLKDHLPSQEELIVGLRKGLEERFTMVETHWDDAEAFVSRPHRQATTLVDL